MNILVVLLIFMPVVQSSLSNNFLDWLKKNYGEEVASQLNRADLGDRGSFGGGNHEGGKKTEREPIIFVPSSGEYMNYYDYMRRSFMNNGYHDSELYGTSYRTEKNLYEEAMKCEHVEQVRNLIKAVSKFTDSKVVVAAYGMGSPIARKAIMGGPCVDNKEKNLGEPLTNLVHIYLSGGGANFGVASCEKYPQTNGCNNVTGLSCDSAFLSDVNSKKHYEGSFVTTIILKRDEVVGYEGCGGKILASLAKSNYTILNVKDNKRKLIHHDKCIQEQYEIITKKIPDLEKPLEDE